MSKFKIKKVFTNRDYTPYSISRDLSIKKFLMKHNIEFMDFKDHVLFEKNEVVKDDGNPYKVYTPYSKKWISKINLKSIVSVGKGFYICTRFAL